MKSFHQSITVLLFLIGIQFHSLLADQSSLESVSAILQSYADAFTTVKSTEQTTTPKFFGIEVKNPSVVHNFTANKAPEPSPLPSNVQPKEADSDPIPSSYDDYSSLSYEASDEGEDPKGPPDHVIPFSEHENPREPSTKPNHTAPGEWAKPSADKDIKLDFVPTKLYAQVRGTHTVKHLPQEDAIKSAETEEEKENAARLKEVVKESKANTVYTEEGYEDAAYDHAGQIRDADFHEGYARNLEEELERKRNYSGKRRKPRRHRKRRPRKGKSRKLDDYRDDYRDHAEVIEEARTSKQRVRPEDVHVLKEALSKPVINPKTVAEHEISQLERDLEQESLLAQRTSTELYATTTTETPSVTESIYQNQVDLETTTVRRDVFTVRPRKQIIAMKPPSYILKPRRPAKLFTISKSNDNLRDYSEQPTTINYGSSVWQYLLNKNETPNVTYRPTYFEPQTVNPVLANPLAVATVNGHGPYLVMVTSAPDGLTAGPLEHQNSETTIRYVTAPIENVTKPTMTNRNGNQSPYLSITRKVKYADRHKRPPPKLRPRLQSIQPSNQKLVRYDVYSSPKQKPPLPPAATAHYPRRGKTNYENYYTLMKPPVPNDLISYPEYSHEPAQWSMTASESDVESVYNEDAEPQRTASPVTRLLPPSPLSTSEYQSFHARSRNVIKPITPTVMAMVPIIEAIHKSEHEPKYFPFLFRRKRSTLEYSRPQMETTRRHQNTGLTKANGTHGKIAIGKYPAHFNFLLNESPRVATKVVDEEIKNRFKDKPEGGSGETSNESSNKASEEYSKENAQEKPIENGNSGEKNIEVEVPELDFSSVFEPDEPEPTTMKPGVDTVKYPFYRDSKADNTAIKYVVNPKEVPRKTLGGMEFYNSRDLECEEVDPSLESVVPEEEELAEKRGPRKSRPRLHGLGDKIDCYRAKYFDENPLDNPLFLEKDVEMPVPPTELNPKQFASRILELPSEKDEYVIPQGPKYPEYVQIKRNAKIRNSPRKHATYGADHVSPARTKRPISIHRNRNRNQVTPNPIIDSENRTKPNRTRIRSTKRPKTKVAPSYQRLVYEDVMDTIMNMEKMKKSHVPKRGAIPHLKYPHREAVHRNNNKANRYNNSNNNKYNTTEKPKPNEYDEIEGLVPPPKYSSFLLTSSFRNSNKPVNNNPRYSRQSRSEDFSRGSRISKREVAVSDEEISEEEGKTEEVTSLTNPRINGTNKGSAEVSFRIVLTTPQSEEAVTITSESPSTKRVYTIHDRIQGRYNKFSDNSTTLAPTTDTPRQEPRYNNPNYRNITATKRRKSPEVTIQFASDPSVASSTLIPVIVKPDDNFTPRVPQESKRNFVKKAAQNPRDVNNERMGDIGIPEKNPKDEYLVFENHEDNDINNGRGRKDVIPVFTAKPHEEEHKELYDFLAGDPPGYAKAFGEGEDVSDRESRSRETLEDQETQNNANISAGGEDKEDEESNDENTEEPYEVEETTENPDEETADNSTSNQSEREASSSKSHESDGEPFVRFSSRPYSPPENYEDEKYAEIGPRVNKPYFYHPPFEAPDYELEKAVDHSADDHEQNEETEDHEEYAFPWANDNDEDEVDGDETKDHSTSDRYEYPWEKRERRAKERKQKTKKYHRENNYDDEDGDGEETKLRPIFVPLKKKYFRNKKDVKNEEITMNEPSSKFSSKYKSAAAVVPPIGDAKTVANAEEFEQAILSYLQSAKPSKFRPKKFLKNLTNETSKLHDKNNNQTTDETSTIKPHVKTPTPRSSRLSRFSTPSSSTTTTTTTSNSVRGRYRIPNTNGSTTKLSSRMSQNPVSSTPASRGIRRRGRGGSVNPATTSTTTSTPTHSNIRRRMRPSTSQQNSTVSPANNPAERRRRPFRIVSANSPRTNQSRSTSSTTPTSTGKTVEHHSRVSKEMIITETVSDDDDDDDSKNGKRNNAKAASETIPVNVRLRRRGKPKNATEDEPAKKKERVEKVTITMEETPEHVYKTKEVDKDGVKGKFVTITANNNTDTAEKMDEDEPPVGDAEMEEMKRRMDAYKSFDSEVKDTEDLVDEPSGVHATKKYIDGKISKISTLSSNGRVNSRSKTSDPSDEEDDEEDDDEDYDEEEDEDDEEEDDDDDDEDGVQENKKNNVRGQEKLPEMIDNKATESRKDDEQEKEKPVEKSDKNENTTEKADDVKVEKQNTTEKVVGEKTPADFIKNPSDRNYFYVEAR